MIKSIWLRTAIEKVAGDDEAMIRINWIKAGRFKPFKDWSKATMGVGEGKVCSSV